MSRRTIFAAYGAALCLALGCEASVSDGTPGTGRGSSSGDAPDAGGAEDRTPPTSDAGATPPRTLGEERCNGLDDDGDGEVDESCDCAVGESQACWPGDPAMRGRDGCADGTQRCVADGEFARWGACEGWTDCEPRECTPESPFEAGSLLPACKDGVDNDCDGRVDCSDPECFVPGLTEDVCDDGYDDDCDGMIDCDDPDCATAAVCDTPDDGCGGECIPGTARWCDTPIACAWGKQTCDADGRWGACREVLERPRGCSGFFYDRECCVDAGACCQNFPIDDTSVGSCTGIVPPAC